MLYTKPYLSRYNTWGNSNLLWIFSGLPNAWLNSNLDNSNVNTGGNLVNQCWKKQQQKNLMSPVVFSIAVLGAGWGSGIFIYIITVLTPQTHDQVCNSTKAQLPPPKFSTPLGNSKDGAFSFLIRKEKNFLTTLLLPQ